MATKASIVRRLDEAVARRPAQVVKAPKGNFSRSWYAAGKQAKTSIWLEASLTRSVRGLSPWIAETRPPGMGDPARLREMSNEDIALATAVAENFSAFEKERLARRDDIINTREGG